MRCVVSSTWGNGYEGKHLNVQWANVRLPYCVGMNGVQPNAGKRNEYPVTKQQRTVLVGGKRRHVHPEPRCSVQSLRGSV